MNNISRVLILASASAIAFMPDGVADGAGGIPQPSDNGPSPMPEGKTPSYIVHMNDQPGTLELSASGKVVTEPFDVPEWAGSVVLGQLAERNKFYQDRLGADLAAPLVDTNIINYADLSWVALDDEGLVVELLADAEYRQEVIASALGVDRDTGNIDNAVMEHYIDRDNKGVALDELTSQADHDAHFAQDESKQQAKGQQ